MDEKVDFTSYCLTYSFISTFCSHFFLYSLQLGHSEHMDGGELRVRCAFEAVAMSHGSGRRAPLFAGETGSDYNCGLNKLSYEKSGLCRVKGADYVILTGVPARGEVRPVLACVAGSCPCVYRLVHPTGHIYNMHVACKNVYDSLLNIIMAQFVSMN